MSVRQSLLGTEHHIYGQIESDSEAPSNAEDAGASQCKTQKKFGKNLREANKLPGFGYMALALYTLARCVANLLSVKELGMLLAKPIDGFFPLDGVRTPGVQWGKSFSELFSCYADAVARPLMSGLGVYLFISPRSRFSPKLRLHVMSWRGMLQLSNFMCDQSVELHLVKGAHFSAELVFAQLYLTWQILCNGLQWQITTVKIQSLGWSRLAWICNFLSLAITVGVLPFFSWTYSHVTFSVRTTKYLDRLSEYATPFALMCCGTLISIQAVALLFAAYRAAACAHQFSDRTMRWTACAFLANAILVLAGPSVGLVAIITFPSQLDHVPFIGGTLGVHTSPTRKDQHMPNRWWPMIDLALQVGNVLLLSGMIGPRRFDLREFKKVAQVSDFGLAKRRVAFPGKINIRKKDCIVSFPGKYSQEWDQAVEAVTNQDMCSLACVFLTDPASGLGKHAADMPSMPGQCWCHVIYGRLDAKTYISTVDVDEEGDDEQMLAFKYADAEAMGQQLLIKRHQSELEWNREWTEALHYAEESCEKNHGKAPWGCMWFELWKRRVDEAFKLGQTLHVFYFEGKVGKGKMAWDELCDQEVKARAREGTGLGASQTAEVAYLEKQGYRYVEHDITSFKTFMAQAR